MSIYATLWSLQFPRYGDYYVGCEWIRVTAQGVPAHIGTPTRGFGYEEGDPYAEFLPPAMEVNTDGDGGIKGDISKRDGPVKYLRVDFLF